MKNEDEILDYYRSDKYLSQNKVDNSSDGGVVVRWKVDLVLPLVRYAASLVEADQVSLLDIGGGAGLCIKRISKNLREDLDLRVDKYVIDLSPGFIALQVRNNPDVVEALNEDIRMTSLHDRQIDISLMIDVLEHIPAPERALDELKRISAYTVFKQPLEDNLVLNLYNCLTKDRQKNHGMRTTGHINFYSFKSFRKQIESLGGRVVKYEFPNVFEHYIRTGYYNGKHTAKRLMNKCGAIVYKISPRLSALLFNNYVIALVKW